MTVVLKPARNTQREAEQALEMAKTLVHTRGDKLGIVKLDHVTICPNYTEPTKTLTIYSGDRGVVLQAIWSDDSGERPFIVKFDFGPWRWILRRAHAARLAALETT